MADFERAILNVLRHEGVEFGPGGQPVPGRTGYVDHLDDPGGETNFGVTRKVARDSGYAGPMCDIPYPKVLDIYRRRYRDDLRGDEIPDQEIAEELFDTGVNCGMPAVKKFLHPGTKDSNLVSRSASSMYRTHWSESSARRTQSRYQGATATRKATRRAPTGAATPRRATTPFRRIERLGLVRRTMVPVLVTRERLVPTDDPA